MSQETETPTDRERRTGVIAATLYLVNLLLAPFFAFIGLLWLNSRAETKASSFASHHVRQNLFGSIIAGSLIIGPPALTLLVSQSMMAWTFAILWLVTWHATMVLLGVISLTRAMNGKPFTYPVFGRWIDKQ